MGRGAPWWGHCSPSLCRSRCRQPCTAARAWSAVVRPGLASRHADAVATTDSCWVNNSRPFLCCLALSTYGSSVQGPQRGEVHQHCVLGIMSKALLQHDAGPRLSIAPLPEEIGNGGPFALPSVSRSLDCQPALHTTSPNWCHASLGCPVLSSLPSVWRDRTACARLHSTCVGPACCLSRGALRHHLQVVCSIRSGQKTTRRLPLSTPHLC